MKHSIIIENRKARFDYTVEGTYTAGIILTGPEVCAIRDGKCNIVDSYCYVDRNRVVMTGMRITLPAGTMFAKTRDTDEPHYLLLNTKEIKKIEKAAERPGYTVIPLKIFRNERGLFKVLIGVCRGKRDFDKRETIKERDNKRNLERVIKQY